MSLINAQACARLPPDDLCMATERIICRLTDTGYGLTHGWITLRPALTLTLAGIMTNLSGIVIALRAALRAEKSRPFNETAAGDTGRDLIRAECTALVGRHRRDRIRRHMRQTVEFA